MPRAQKTRIRGQESLPGKRKTVNPRGASPECWMAVLGTDDFLYEMDPNRSFLGVFV